MADKHFVRLGINPLPWILDVDFHLDVPSLAAGFAVVSRAGFKAVQADIPEGMGTDEYLDFLYLFGLIPAPSYLGMDFGEEPVTETQLEDVRSFCRQQRQIGNTMAFLAGNLTPKRSKQPLQPGTQVLPLPLLVDRVRQIAQLMVDEGIYPLYHQHVGTAVENEGELRAVLDSIPEEVLGFGPDTGHLRWAGIDASALIAQYGARIKAAHIKDVDLTAVQEAAAREASYHQSTMDIKVWSEPGLGGPEVGGLVKQLFALDGLEWAVIEVDVPKTGDATNSTMLTAQWLREQEDTRELIGGIQ